MSKNNNTSQNIQLIVVYFEVESKGMLSVISNQRTRFVPVNIRV